MSRDAVFMSWWAPKASYYRKMEKITDRLGTACNIQAMVFGNMGDTSCTGVGFTRDPGTGEKVFYGEFLVNAQGEDVVAGIRTPQPISELKAWNAGVYNQLREITTSLEKHYKRHAGLRVHRAGRHPVHAADPQRQAHRSGRGQRRRRDGRRKASSTRRRPSCASPRRSSTSSSTRSSIPPR